MQIKNISAIFTVFAINNNCNGLQCFQCSGERKSSDLVNFYPKDSQIPKCGIKETGILTQCNVKEIQHISLVYLWQFWTYQIIKVKVFQWLSIEILRCSPSDDSLNIPKTTRNMKNNIPSIFGNGCIAPVLRVIFNQIDRKIRENLAAPI